MANELYIYFGFGAFLLLGIILAYYSSLKFEILIVFFAFSALVASMFFTNVPEWISVERETGPGGYLRGLLLLFSGIMGFIYFLKKSRIHKWNISYHIIFLLLFIIFSFISTFYSIDSKNTFLRSGLFFILFLFLVGLDEWLDSEKKFDILLDTLYKVVIFFILLNLIVLIFFPDRVWWWKSPSRFLGLSSHPNELGGFCIAAFPIILRKLYNEKGKNKIYPLIFLIFNILILFITGSRTSLLVSTVAVIVWFIVYRDWIKLLSLSLVLLLGLLFLTQLKIPSFQRNEGASLTNLTEREYIWEGGLIIAQKAPIIGYGYAVESKIFADQYLYDLEGTNLDINAQNPLHNGYLSIFIGGGVIGLILWIFALGIPLYLIIKSYNLNIRAYVIASLVPVLLANFVESAITGYLSSSDIYFWFAWVVGGKLVVIERKKNTIETDIRHNKEYFAK